MIFPVFTDTYTSTSILLISAKIILFPHLSFIINIYIYKFLTYILDDNDDDADQIEMGSDDGGGDDDGGEEEDDDVSTRGRGTSRVRAV